MSKNNFTPLSVSQNFLTSRVTITRLLKLTSLNKNDYVIEIGAGKGHITGELLKRCGNVSAFEKDAKLAGYLQNKFNNADNLKLLQSDFLCANLPNNSDYKVFSNIPFSITTAIVRKLTETPNPPKESWLVIEKGAAKRFMGKPNETEFSLSLKPFFTINIRYYFNRGDFHPMPNTDTVLIHVARKENPDIPKNMRGEFIAFIKKGMRYGISSLLTRRQVKTALKLAGLSDIEESGEILYVQWLCLFRCYRGLNRG